MRLGLACLAAFASDAPSVDVGGLLWENGGHDRRTGFASIRIEGRDCPQYWAADDFIVQTSWRVTTAAAEFYVDLGGSQPFDLADIAVWRQPRPGAEPGDLVVEVRDLPIEWKQVGEGFGYPIISAKVTGLNVSLPPGDYYFSMRLVVQVGHGWWAWLSTAGNGNIKGRTGGWIWYCNPPRWDRLWSYFSRHPRWLSTTDFAFSLEGEILP